MAQYQVSGRTSASIAASIEAGVASGELAPAELLPPVRALAERLGVSAGTVASAYRLTRQRGLTVAERRRGTRVRPWASTPPGPPAGRTAGRQPSGLIDLASGAPDPEFLPDLAAVAGAARYEPASYGASPLAPALARVVERQLRHEGISADGLTCASGTLDAVGRLLSASLRSGDRVAIEDPGWPALIAAVRFFGFQPVPLAIDTEGVLPGSLWERLAGGACAVVITNRAQNPTGASLTPRRRDELTAVLARYPGVLVLEDDHGDGITRAELHPLARGGPGTTRPGPWAFIRSAGKSLGPDLRLAVVAGDRSSIARLSASLAAGPGWVSYLLQAAVARLWGDGWTGSAADYDARRMALVEALEQAGVAVTAPSGLNVWVPVENEMAAVALLAERGYEVAPGAPFRLASPAAIRVTTASLLPEKAPPLAEAIAQARLAAPAGY